MNDIAVPHPSSSSARKNFFFFQAEDGIRDIGVTGVQTCALPIYRQALNETVSHFKFTSKIDNESAPAGPLPRRQINVFGHGSNRNNPAFFAIFRAKGDPVSNRVDRMPGADWSSVDLH